MSIHAQPNPEALQRLRRQQRMSTISSFVVAILSIAILAVVLGFFLLPMVSKEVPVIVAYSSSLEKENKVEQKKVTTKVTRKPSSPSSSMAKVIAANIPSPTAIPIPEEIVTTQSLDFGDGNDFGEGWDAGNSGTTGGLFGIQVTSGNLGVVLDISGSAHGHLDKAIAEIDKSFPTAHMVLVVGCGMSDGKGAMGGGGGKVPGKPRVVPYNSIDTEGANNSLTRSAPAQLELFFGKSAEKRRKELRRYFDKRDNLYMLYGGDIHGTNFAFDFLLERNVDTIYWFADFADRIDPKTSEDLTKELQRKRVTVIAHNFLGKSVGKLATEMTEKTGGQTIEVIPGEN